MADRQLENNTTKALANLLAQSGSTVRKQFLHWLGIKADGSNLQVDIQRARPRGGQIHIQNAKIRRVVLLSGKGTDTTLAPGPVARSVPLEPTNASGVPDAWLCGTGFAVLVESKLGTAVDWQQVGRHLSMLGENTRSVVWRTWDEVHELCAGLDSDAPLSAVDRFLVGQFVRYLEMIGQARFVRFLPEHFEFFVDPSDPELRQWVRHSLQDLGHQVLENLGHHEFGVHVGVIRKASEYGWVGIAPPGRVSAHPHLTIGMNSGGIEVHVTVDAEPARSKLRRVLTHRRDDLRDEVAKLDGFQVRVSEKVRRQGKQFDYFPVLILHCSQLTEERDPAAERFNWLAQQVESLRLPTFYVAKWFTVAESLKMGDRTVAQVTDVARRLEPVIRLIDGG